MKITLKGDALHEAIEDGDEVACEPWRWGTNRTYVFEKDGKHFRFTARFHSRRFPCAGQWAEECVQDEQANAVEVRAVEKTVTVWEPVEDR